MSKEKQIEEMAKIICGNDRDCKNCVHNCATRECGCLFYAKRLYEQRYRKQSEVIDDFVKRLLDAFPEGNRDALCPAIYYDVYRDIIEECGAEMKGD